MGALATPTSASWLLCHLLPLPNPPPFYGGGDQIGDASLSGHQNGPMVWGGDQIGDASLSGYQNGPMVWGGDQIGDVSLSGYQNLLPRFHLLPRGFHLLQAGVLQCHPLFGDDLLHLTETAFKFAVGVLQRSFRFAAKVT